MGPSLARGVNLDEKSRDKWTQLRDNSLIKRTGTNATLMSPKPRYLKRSHSEYTYFLDRCHSDISEHSTDVLCSFVHFKPELCDVKDVQVKVHSGASVVSRM